MSAHCPLQLSTSGKDIQSPGLPDKRRDSLPNQPSLKCRHIRRSRLVKFNARPRIPNNQVDLGWQIRTPEKRNNLVSVFQPVIHAAQQDIFEGHPLLRAQRHLTHCIQHSTDIPLAGHRHDPLADFVVRRVQRNRQLRPYLLRTESQYPRNNARSRDRHPRLGDANFGHQQPHRTHELVIVQERLAHTHEHQVDAVAADLHALALQYCDHLTGDLPRRQVALNPQLRGQTKLTVHRTAYLARNAYRCPMMFRRPRGRFFGSRFGPVASFSVVTLRHPDGLDRVGIVACDQVALSAVRRSEGLQNLRQPDPIPLGDQLLTKRFRPGGELAQIADPTPIERFGKLFCSVGRCGNISTQSAKLLNRKAENWARDSMPRSV